jgi:Helix-turn-helix domain/HRDC domain
MLPLLEKERERYTLREMKTLFNLQPPIVKMNEFIKYLGERQLHEKEKFISQMYEMKNALLQLNEVAEKFLSWVDEIAANGMHSDARKQLDNRLVKAKAYFEKEFDEKVNQPLTEMNKELQQKNKVRKLLKEMKSFISSFEHFTNRYRNEPVKMEEKFSPLKPYSAKEIPEEASQQLFQELRQIRREVADEENVAPYMICHDASLIEMSTYFPHTITDLAMIKGMGDHSLRKYSEAFLTAIRNFSELHGLVARMDLKEAEVRKKRAEKKNKPATEGDSKTESFKLFGVGKTIEEIASIRQMASSTIEGHLAHFVKTGELDVFRLLPKEKFERISEAIRKTEFSGLRSVKDILDDSISYAEIRFVFNAMNGSQEQKLETKHPD